MQILGQKWFPLLKGFPPHRAERSEAQRAARRAVARNFLINKIKKLNAR